MRKRLSGLKGLAAAFLAALLLGGCTPGNASSALSSGVSSAPASSGAADAPDQRIVVFDEARQGDKLSSYLGTRIDDSFYILFNNGAMINLGKFTWYSGSDYEPVYIGQGGNDAYFLICRDDGLSHGSTGRINDLYRYSYNGTLELVVQNVQDWMITPGQEYFFITDNATLYRLELASKTLADVCQKPDAYAFSPNGEYVLYKSGTTLLLQAVGGNPVELAKGLQADEIPYGAANNGSMAWATSQDGGKQFVRVYTLQNCSVQTADSEPIKFDYTKIYTNQDGTQVAFSYRESRDDTPGRFDNLLTANIYSQGRGWKTMTYDASDAYYAMDSSDFYCETRINNWYGNSKDGMASARGSFYINTSSIDGFFVYYHKEETYNFYVPGGVAYFSFEEETMLPLMEKEIHNMATGNNKLVVETGDGLYSLWAENGQPQVEQLYQYEPQFQYDFYPDDQNPGAYYSLKKTGDWDWTERILVYKNGGDGVVADIAVDGKLVRTYEEFASGEILFASPNMESILFMVVDETKENGDVKTGTVKFYHQNQLVYTFTQNMEQVDTNDYVDHNYIVLDDGRFFYQLEGTVLYFDGAQLTVLDGAENILASD